MFPRSRCRASPAGTSRAHRRHRLQHPLNNGIGGVQHDKLRLGLGTAAFGRNRDLDRIALDEFNRNAGWRIVLGVLPRPRWIGQYRRPQLVIRIEICPSHAFIDHPLEIKRRAALRRTFETHIHSDLDECRNNSSILADRPMPLGAHPAVDQNLRHGILGRSRLFLLISLRQAANVIHRVVVADVLQRPRNAGDKIFLQDNSHSDPLLELFRLMHTSRICPVAAGYYPWSGMNDSMQIEYPYAQSRRPSRASAPSSLAPVHS